MSAKPVPVAIERTRILAMASRAIWLYETSSSFTDRVRYTDRADALLEIIEISDLVDAGDEVPGMGLTLRERYDRLRDREMENWK